MVFKMIAWLLVVLMVVSGWGCATPSKSYDPHKINVPKEDNIFVSVTLAVLAIVLLAAAAKEARKQKIAMQTAIMEAAKEARKRQTAIMESWKGHSIAQLIRSWGPLRKRLYQMVLMVKSISGRNLSILHLRRDPSNGKERILMMAIQRIYV